MVPRESGRSAKDAGPKRHLSRPARTGAGADTRRRITRSDVQRPGPVAASAHDKKLRVIPLGGVGEFGRNMMVIEYGNDMLVIDVGFMFPNTTMPGIDYVLPDIEYVRKNRHKLRGIFITHGHMDHMGGIPYLIKEMGMPTVYGSKLTIGMVQERLEEFNLVRHVRCAEVHPDDTLQLGSFKLTFFRVNHNIPDSLGVAVHSPIGTIINTGDWKFDHTPQDERPTEFGKLARLGEEGVLMLCSDSTNSTKPGFCISEKDVGESLETLFRKAQGRIIVATFSSLISRIQQIINASVSLERKVAISGMSMEKALTVASKLGFLKVPRGTIIKLDEIGKYPDHRVVVISTGSQGQESSALGRMARGEHRHVKIQPGDTVVLSSSPIPGNERAITALMDNLFRLGANVIYNQLFDVHTSGHAHNEEQKLMLGLTRPKYFMPIHGERHMQVRHAEIARQLGWDDKNIFVVDNGAIIEFNAQGQGRVAPQKVDVDYIMVDGLGVGDIGNVVLRDRQVLAEDGMVVIIATVDKHGKLTATPDIISRGFIYVKSAEHILQEVRVLVKKLIDGATVEDMNNWTPVRNKVRDDVGLLLFQRTEKRPMILPVIIKV